MHVIASAMYIKCCLELKPSVHPNVGWYNTSRMCGATLRRTLLLMLIVITLIEEGKGSEVPTRPPPTVSCGTTCGQDRMRKNGQKIVGGVDAGVGEIGWQGRLKTIECTLWVYIIIIKILLARSFLCQGLDVGVHSSTTSGFLVPPIASIRTEYFKG